MFADRPGMPRIEANVNLLSEAARVVASGASGVGLVSLGDALPGSPNLADRGRAGRDLSQADRCARKAVPQPSAPLTSARTSWRMGPPPHPRWHKRWTGGWFWSRPSFSACSRSRCGPSSGPRRHGPVRLLIPLVTRTRLLEFVIATVEQARQELLREELEFGRDVPLGVMIEVAAVTPLIDAWSDRVDFFSLGTNDLIASALGINRDDPVGTLGDDILHPGLIRMIGEMIASAHRGGRPVSVCGEMAADPEGAIALAALGADSLSLGSRSSRLHPPAHEPA